MRYGGCSRQSCAQVNKNPQQAGALINCYRHDVYISFGDRLQKIPCLWHLVLIYIALGNCVYCNYN